MINVIKRNGKKEPLDIGKIHKVVEWACEGLSGVSVSEIEINAQIQFFNGIKSSAIHETLIKAASELISEDTPNYQYVAGRLINYQLRKTVYGKFQPDFLYDHYLRIEKLGYYDSSLKTSYSAEEWKELSEYVNHDRDFDVVFAGMEQLRGKYLVKDRTSETIYETPQIAYMLIAMSLFSSYTNDRIKWVKDLYDALSTFDISLPTPIMAGVRTPLRQFSSCVLIDSDDSLDSINAAASGVVKYVSQKAGIGLNGGAIRAEKSPVRNGDTSHTGLPPFWRYWQSATASCSQGSVRKGSATISWPVWHKDFEELIVLKNNKGTEESRVRHMDYCVQFNKVMYERIVDGGNITLFSPHEVPEVYDAFYSSDVDKFRELYEKAEKNPKLTKKVMSAKDLFSAVITERSDTHRIYISNIDHCNSHSSYVEELAPIKMTNLCVSGETMIHVIRKYASLAEEIKIKDAKIGDLVFSRNLDTGKNEFKKITNWAKMGTDRKTVKISLPGYELVCTPDHKIYTENRDYVEAAHLKEDDILVVDRFTKTLSPVRVRESENQDVYDITVEDNNNFYANGILVHNCVEITLPTKPLKDINDEEGRIALCTLGAINWGKIKKPKDFKKPTEILVRALDALLDFQEYPVKAAKLHSMEYRPLGTGPINIAYWLAKNGTNYSNPNLDLIHEYVEAWTYYTIEASIKLAEEFGPCLKSSHSKYSHGIFPIDTYKKDVDELVAPNYNYDWDSLKERAKKAGIRNSTLFAGFPAETSAQLSNSTNGVEPPRAFVSVKQSKDGVLKQVVPEVQKLKNKYDLAWEQESPKGYLSVLAVFQKMMDQAISVNTTYNTKFYPDEKIPESVIGEDILFFYKYGGKNLYYFNSPDGAGEKELLPLESQIIEEEDCDSCKV